nr:UvrD-like helicase, ATP-binding domain, P-loop containing nucleoside triphosphate hydrolase [Tanacetum cinerariifolium]
PRYLDFQVGFVTNFPDSFGSRDLWSLCEKYGKVVDVFIPNRKSKAGKRFAFVRSIRVDDMDRLIGNLCTLWVGRLHLQANAMRYERPPKSSPSVKLPPVKSYAPFTSSPSSSFADAVKDIKNVPPHSTKDVNSIPNLHTILTNEGFMDVKLSYLGGLWVMIELNSEETKMKLLQYNGVNLWFEELKPASHEFVCNERIVWVDIEGIPLHLWSSSTFSRIGMKWGTVMDIEESLSSSFARKRLCIKTSMDVNILETFKDPGYLSEDESSLDGNNNLGNSQQGNVNQVEGSDVEEASHGNDYSADSSTHVSSCSTPKGGYILEVLDGMIKVGRFMGYDMEGCSKDIEQIIRLQGEADGIK